MITFFKKLFGRGDVMMPADRWYYGKVFRTTFWSLFSLIVIAWVGTNLVLCALATDVSSNFDVIFEAARVVTLPTGKDFNAILKKMSYFQDDWADGIIQTITFDRFTGGEEDRYMVGDVNVLSGAAKEPVSVENGIYLYRANGGADVYILSNNKMQANPDSSYMFYCLLGATSYTFNNFDTSKVQSFSHAFAGSNQINHFTNYTISTAPVKVESSKFQTLAGGDFAPIPTIIQTLDLSKWDTSSLMDTSYMFNMCSNLKTIFVGENFVMGQVEKSDSMFFDCNAIKGSEGTGYNSKFTDKTYARVDQGPNSAAPGYFTAK